jgi:hypothetical protein
MRALLLVLAACGDDAVSPDAGTRADSGTDAGLEGRTFYMALDGDDTNDGSAAAPFLTFAHSIGALAPGDTLLVRDGDYTGDRIYYDCVSATRCDGSPCPTGTPGAPITVRAEHERAVEIGTTDLTPIAVVGCSYVSIEGFYVHQSDAMTKPGSAPVVSIERADHVAIRRLLVAAPNRYLNSHAIRVTDSRHPLIEECEVYDYHRSGIALYRTEHAVLRRNYVNSRDVPNLEMGFNCCDATRGDYGFWIGAAFATLAENNIAERNSRAFLVTALVDGVEAFGPNASKGHRFIGNVALVAERGIDVTSNCESADPCPIENVSSDVEIVDMAVIATTESFYGNSVPRLVLRNVTSIDASNLDFWIRRGETNLAVVPTLAALDALDVGGGSGDGWHVEGQGDATVTRSNSFGNAADIVSGMESFTAHAAIDPMLGGCRIAIPPASPMRGAGSRGGDIGANVLFRTVDGFRTSEPLWDDATDAFACGAIVAGGPNDPAMHDETCSNVHERLGVAACR